MWVTHLLQIGSVMDVSHYKTCTSSVVCCSAVCCSAVNMQFMCHRGCIVRRKKQCSIKMEIRFTLFLLMSCFPCFHFPPVCTWLLYYTLFIFPTSTHFVQVAFDSHLLTHLHQWHFALRIWYDMNVDKANSFISVKLYHFNVCFTSLVISYITSKEKHIWSSVVATELLPISKFGPSCLRVAKYSIPLLSLFWSCHSREETGGDWKIW